MITSAGFSPSLRTRNDSEPYAAAPAASASSIESKTPQKALTLHNGEATGMSGGPFTLV
jgi:hypothetical protein